MKRVKHQIIVEKPVDNYVENYGKYTQIIIFILESVNIYMVIIGFSATFPLFFAEKRYKLIKFAPKIVIVDK